MTGRWRLATCSYAAYEAEFGEPVRTSVGPHPQYRDIEHIGALTPYGVFGTMAEQPIEEQRAAYLARLHRLAASIENRLDRLTAQHPGDVVVLLCWCRHPETCHRRWAADWLTDLYGIEVPELATTPPNNATAGGHEAPTQPPLPGTGPSAAYDEPTADQHQPSRDPS